jgi:hypothetical protein
MLERTIMRRILVLASAAAVAMLAFAPLAEAQTSTKPAVHHSTTVKKTAHMAKAKKKAPVKHKVAAKKVAKKKKPPVRTSAIAPRGIQA